MNVKTSALKALGDDPQTPIEGRLLPSNSLQTRVPPIEQGTVALTWGCTPELLCGGFGGVSPPSDGGTGGSPPAQVHNAAPLHCQTQ